MSQKLFDNNLVGIRQSKVTLKYNKPAHVGVCILDFSKVLMYKFRHYYIKNKYDNNSRLVFLNTYSLMHETKMEDAFDFSKDRKMFDFSNYLAKSKHYDNSNKLVVGKMEYEIGGVAIEELTVLKPKIYSYLVDDSSEHGKERV